MPTSDGHEGKHRATKKARPPKHDFGVLFVHGVGQQPEGDTLLAWGEPLIRWADRWLSRGSKEGTTGSFHVLSTRLTPSKTGDAFPPHATAELRVKENGTQRESSWVLAESWWGGDVQPPPFGRFAGWLLTTGAWTAVAHVTKWSRVRENKVARVGVELLMTLLGLIVAMLLQVAVLAVSILALLPIPPLRRGLSRVLLVITWVLGDCFVLVESDLQRAAIVTRTRTALRWLARECKRVVVIAHSQGATVAHYTLRQSKPENVELLLTLGSGLGKLSELEHAGRTMDRVRSMARMAPLVGILLSLVAYITLFERLDDLSQLALIFVGVLALFSYLGVFFMARQHWENVEERAGALSLETVRKDLRWVDIHAARDPVPNGEMFPGGVKVPGVTAHPVVNLGSMVGDHTSYWQNRSEFVPLVLREISTTLGLGLFGEKDHAALDDVARRHHQNVVWLKVSRWATLLSVGLMFWLYGDVLLTRGRELAPLLTGAGTPLESLATRVKDVVMFVLRLVFRDKSGTIGLQLLGAAVPMALVALWLYAYRFLWRWWDGIALEAVFKPGSIGRKDQSVLAGIIIAVGVTPLAIVLAWPLIARIQVSHLIAGAWIAAFTILILVSVFGLTRTGWDSVRKSLKGDLDAWKDLKEKLKLIGVMVGTLAFFLLSAIPALEPFRGSAAALLGIAGSIYFLVRIQIGYIKRARERYQDAIAWTVIAAPPVIALSGTAILTAVLGPQNEAGMPPYSGFLISFFVLYFVTIGVANWLVGRSARSKNAV